ncbi:hypothetical protein M8C21_014012, partial [Ambrosia artemisiifolia]
MFIELQFQKICGNIMTRASRTSWFDSQLEDACLFGTTASCSLIKLLILMSCTYVGSDGLAFLRGLPNLTSLAEVDKNI